MTTKPKNQEGPENEHRLLSSDERAILSLVATQESPHSQRAQALLAIDEGATQAEAGSQVGLTKGQVRYWLGKFRKDGTSIFPEELVDQAQQDAGEEEVQQELPDEAETAGPADEAAEHQADAPKAKKKSGQKSGKKSKKSKKGKKAKKGKKSTKKTKKKGSKKAKGAKGKSGKKAGKKALKKGKK